MNKTIGQVGEIWNDILQIWFGGYLDLVSGQRRDQISPQSHLKKIKIILKDFYGSVIRLFIVKRIPKDKVWFFSISSNNYNALSSIQKNVSDSIFVSRYSIKEGPNYETCFCDYRFRFFYLLFFPINFFVYFFSYRSKAVFYYDLLFKTCGYYSESLRILKKYRPRAIVFTNDHEIAPRALLLAAKKLNITSYYVQHASVSKYFPPLKFDYALLEGQDAKNKYLAIGKTNSKICLIGMPKLDKYVQWMNTKSKIESIGIAYNAMDNINLVKELINQLTGTFPDLKFVIRAHPSDKRTLKIQKVHLSNSKVENSFEFLNRIDALIASDSSIHLEAVLLNVFSMSYNFNDNRFLDYYGFVQNNLINHYSGKTNLIKKINSLRSNKPYVQNKAKYYNAAIESDFYGSSSSKAADIIIKTLNF